jgi:2-dehydro-3-deoxy-D-arabinonate dehydratase
MLADIAAPEFPGPAGRILLRSGDRPAPAATPRRTLPDFPTIRSWQTPIESKDSLAMKLCRFETTLISDEATVVDLCAAGITHLADLFEAPDFPAQLDVLAEKELPRYSPRDVQLLAPIERQEVWAVGVTYLRSKKARMEESDFSATAYDKVYEAPRPELFFKSMPEKVVGPGETVGIRSDAKWSVPEPELAFVINSRGNIVGFTIGNDMSSRDIEGENLLYLPQAKIYEKSCAVGPSVVVGATEVEARTWTIQLAIERNVARVFHGETSVSQIKRSFGELVEYLFRSQKFPNGAILLTGTGIVPPDTFTLQAKDKIRISISGIGVLENTVAVV